jgi:hypothetical protein
MDYTPPTEYFSSPELLQKMVAILKGLMVLGEVSIGGKRYAVADATDGSGLCIAVVAHNFKGDEAIGETLLRVDTGLSTLVALAERASKQDISVILANIGMNENYFSQTG